MLKKYFCRLRVKGFGSFIIALFYDKNIFFEAKI